MTRIVCLITCFFLVLSVGMDGGLQVAIYNPELGASYLYGDGEGTRFVSYDEEDDDEIVLEEDFTFASFMDET